MAEPGDPKPPEPPIDPGFDAGVDHDEGVGFPRRRRCKDDLGTRRTPKPLREPVVEPVLEPTPSVAPPVFEPIAPPVAAPPSRPVLPDALPAWAIETPRASNPSSRGSVGRPREAPATIEGGLGLFAVYALILFAVPTLGVSALVALLAVTGRPGPQGEVAASHFIFQQRTLWAGAVAALLGAILIAVGLGVFVLFMLAVWLIVRGAAGVLKLKAGRAMPHPRGWLI